MTVIRVDEESARKLKFFGKTYGDAVKALLDKQDQDNSATTTKASCANTDYDKIRVIVSEEIAKAAVRY